MPQRCVYILICVMDLLDKALGRSAASGEKGGRLRLTASSSSGRHLVALEDIQANGSSVSPDDAAAAGFLLTEHWEMSRQSQPAGKAEKSLLQYQDGHWFYHLWFCVNSCLGEMVSMPLFINTVISIVCSWLISACERRLNTKVFQEKTSKPCHIPTSGTCHQQSILRGQGNISVNVKRK